ncbi:MULTISPECIES: helix-turn-helix domain-containing protein [Brenneria]|uniref:Transcriptional regulator n=2 Tax=Brenneria TaxID=71655 RepID=A0A2U1UCU8_9GAMM|nr:MULTISPECIES: XRE family transcriptional regulator [Brenneria]MCL2893759.1 XRE family transcriptional regulator [Brenneria tiliae]PWC19493.1 transcriptional regulator [Brenneria sp. CFCC 11842]
MNTGIDKPSAETALGQRIRGLRTSKGWTLEQASRACGLARSTLSKIENEQMSPTYDALIKLADGFGIDLSELFAIRRAPMGAGRRCITRAGAGMPHDTPYYHHMLLCNDLSNKVMVPFRSKIVARAFSEFDDWSRHTGEEFVYVLSGQVRLFTEFYEPVDLASGDNWYIDSRMGHRVISLSEEDAEVLWVSTIHP